MHIVLYGGAEYEMDGKRGVPILFALIKNKLEEVAPAQILHIPFGRDYSVSKGEWVDGFFERYVAPKNTILLDARLESDLEKAKNPLIFISGGTLHENIVNRISSNSKILELLQSANNIVAESGGAMALGEYQRIGTQSDYKIENALGLIKNTIIEPHYGVRNRESLLLDELKVSNMKYGIGIDCLAGIEFELDEFPDVWSKISDRQVEVVTYSEADKK